MKTLIRLLIYIMIWHMVYFAVLIRLVNYLVVSHDRIIEDPYMGIWGYGCAQMLSVYTLAITLMVFQNKMIRFLFFQLVLSVSLLFGLCIYSKLCLHQPVNWFLNNALPQFLIFVLVALIPVFTTNRYVVWLKLLALLPVLVCFGGLWIRIPMELLVSQFWIAIISAGFCFVFGNGSPRVDTQTVGNEG
jgi:hypothetical protein